MESSVPTMMASTSTVLLLCSWISVSVSQFHTVEVKPGDEATLTCSNFSSIPLHINWSKLTTRPNASLISSMFSSDSNATLHDGYNKNKFMTTSNNTNIFLNIKLVDFSDSGLYFCGHYKNREQVTYGATYFQVLQEDVSFPSVHVATVVFGCLTLFLLMVVISLVVRIRTLHKAQTERQSPRHTQNLDSDALNYAALSFPVGANRTRTSEPETQLDPHVVYAATR